MENPKKTVPIAVMAGTLIAAVLYIGSTQLIQGIIPGSQLAILPGTTHMQVTRRADLLLPMLTRFLD